MRPVLDASFNNEQYEPASLKQGFKFKVLPVLLRWFTSHKDNKCLLKTGFCYGSAKLYASRAQIQFFWRYDWIQNNFG